MLFGNEYYTQRIRNKISDVEKEQGFRVIFAANVGSISRGIADYTSDYDIKCLFIKNDGLLQENYRHEEQKIRFRKFYEGVPENCIAFWEIGAFINFLTEPYIDHGNKYDLLHNTIWLLNSPYSEDPYGLQQTIFMPLLDKVNLHNECIFYVNVLRKLYGKDLNLDERKLMRLLHACWSIRWISKKNTLPPINLVALTENKKELEMIKRLQGALLEKQKQNSKDADICKIGGV